MTNIFQQSIGVAVHVLTFLRFRVGSNSNVKFRIHSIPLDAKQQRSIVKNQPESLLVVPSGKALAGISHLKVAGEWPAISKRARYSALIAFS